MKTGTETFSFSRLCIPYRLSPKLLTSFEIVELLRLVIDFEGAIRRSGKEPATNVVAHLF